MSQTLVLPVSILSYPNLFEPRAYKNKGIPKYSAAQVLVDDDTLLPLKQAISAVAIERMGDKAKAVLMGNPPIHSREEALAKGYPEGSVYINAKSTRQPGIVSRYKDPATGKPLVITEEMATLPGGPYEMYPGVRVKAYVSVYAYPDGDGIAFGLEGLQRWDEGERLDGRVAPADVFDGEMPDEADLGDIMAGGEEAVTEEAEDPIASIL